MRGNDAKQVKDNEEIFRYRLSMDKQLTEPSNRLAAFLTKYILFHKRAKDETMERKAAR